MREQGRGRLPPLNALKAFEAAARAGGFVAAARELGVTPAAVSQQVKVLEQFFAKQLFQRHSNRLSLTDAGLAVFGESAGPIEQLALMAERVAEGDVHSRLVVSVLPSLANRWLNRLLPEFLAREPSIRIDLRVEEDPVDFSRQGADLRICYGRHLYPELTGQELFQDVALPLCAPGLLKGGELQPGQPDTLADEHLIHTRWGPGFASHPTWLEWFGLTKSGRVPDAGRGHAVGQSSLAIDLAVDGCGVALGQRGLATDELANGRLIAPFEETAPLGHPYCIVRGPQGLRRWQSERFVDWLCDAAGTQPAT